MTVALTGLAQGEMAEGVSQRNKDGTMLNCEDSRLIPPYLHYWQMIWEHEDLTRQAFTSLLGFPRFKQIAYEGRTPHSSEEKAAQKRVMDWIKTHAKDGEFDMATL